ncbi:MAG: hypothetical protein A2Z16_01350 [Chloroflexi bacterium RBG_16_54_18]|nr:MAG: hypothetical protein A2Z16_01350 [Chloroflexi bacterium RBG_16_54_18]
MLEEISTQTKRIPYGRIQVTIPMPVKVSMLSWVKKSGMGRAEFLRVALMIGASQLAEIVKAKKPSEGYYSNQQEEKVSEQATART